MVCTVLYVFEIHIKDLKCTGASYSQTLRLNFISVANGVQFASVASSTSLGLFM